MAVYIILIILYCFSVISDQHFCLFWFFFADNTHGMNGSLSLCVLSPLKGFVSEVRLKQHDNCGSVLIKFTQSKPGYLRALHRNMLHSEMLLTERQQAGALHS